MTEDVFPPLQDLSPNEFETRKQHLLGEITRPRRRRALQDPFAWLSARRRMSLVIALSVAVLVGGGAAVAAVVVTTDQSPLQLAPQQGATPSLGDTADSIIAALKTRVPDVVSITITNDSIPGGSGTTSSKEPVAHIGISAQAPGGAGVARAMWEGNLVGGALVTAFSNAGLTPPVGTDVTLIHPDGSQDNIGGGLGNVVPDQAFDPVGAATQNQIEQNAAAEGLSNVQIQTFPVVNDVLEVTASTSDDPATAAHRFFNAGSLDGLLGQSANHFEGVLFQMNDAQGNPLLLSAAAPRAGGGSFWAAPSTGYGTDILHYP